MKRSGIKRGSVRLRTRKRLRHSQKPIKQRRRPRFKISGKPNKAFRVWIRRLPCVLLRSGWCMEALVRAVFGTTRSDVAHVRSRGAGGVDVGNVVPMCHSHHCEQHAIGKRSFERKYGIDLTKLAAEYETQWQREQGGTP